jgi:predicted ATPase/DNA-binding CsgD family transcriptional regulator
VEPIGAAGRSIVVASATLSTPDTFPIPRTRIIGREDEIGAARRRLLDEAAPLLTLTGPGGVGKTRLALAVAADVADQFAENVVSVDLSPLQDSDQIPIALANALKITPRPQYPVLAELIRHLRVRQLLLVLDNCEHVVEGAAELVATLLGSCPALQVLAVSRAPLRLRIEHILPVAPLPVPHDSFLRGDDIVRNASVRLFVERARAIHPQFALTATNTASVAELCRSLDGLPLAIELAAARIPLLSPAAMLAQMTDRLVLLSDGPRDAPLRQRTISATISWSYDLLPDEAQSLFRSLSVFVGGFTLDAARVVAQPGDAPFAPLLHHLGLLIEHSLIRRVDDDGEPRFTMLETIRAFGLAQLRKHGENDAVRGRHAQWCHSLVTSRQAWVAAYLPESQAILDQLETEYANLHAALTWLREQGDVSRLLAIAGDLVVFWFLRGHLREGRQWLEWGLAQTLTCDPALRANAQFALSSLYQIQYESARALELCEASLAVYRATHDAPRIARSASHAATVSLDFGGPAQADTYLAEALAAFAEIPGEPWAIKARDHLRVLSGIVAKNRGDVAYAEHYLGDLVAGHRDDARVSGITQPFACWPLMAWGAVAHLVGDFPVAFVRYQACLEHAWSHHEARCSAYALTRVAAILAIHGRWREAAWLLGAAEAFAERIGLAFVEAIWPLTRAFGVPEPWQGPDDYRGQARDIRTAVLRRGPAPLPPIPDPIAADALWTSGRSVPVQQAVAHALTVRLDTPPAEGLGSPLPGAIGAPDNCLTPRQREILTLLCHHLTDPEIATRLFLSPRTVEGHVNQILGKLGVASRREAAALAARLALV